MRSSIAAVTVLALFNACLHADELFPPRRLMYLLAGLGVVLLAGLWRGGRAAWTLPHRRLLIGAFVVSLLVAWAPAILSSNPFPLSRVARELTVVLVGWGLLFFLPLHPSPSGAIAPPPAPPKWGLPALLMATLVTLALTHAVTERAYVYSPDETDYLLQSKLMSEPGYARQLGEELRPFFALRQTVFAEGRLYTQYPPGWPVLLAAFSAMGLRWWSGAICGVAGMIFTYFLGKRLRSRAVGLLACVLMGTASPFLLIGGSYLSHVPTLALIVMAAVLLLKGEQSDGAIRVISWWLAGLLLGSAVAVRPLTGVSLGLSLGLWMLVRRRLPARSIISLAGLVAFGVLLPVLALLHYNTVTNGKPLVFGYTAANGTLSDIGFGPRGFMTYDRDMQPLALVRTFNFRTAVQNLAFVSMELNTVVVPAFFLAPLIFIGKLYGYRFPWRVAAVFLVLPAVHFFYVFKGIRFYIELFPFLFLGVADLLLHVWQRNRNLAWHCLSFVMLGNVLVSAVDMYSTYQSRKRKIFPYFEEVIEARRTHERVMVFVAEPPRDENILELLTMFNAGAFPSDVIVARDRGAANAVLTRQFPGYFPIRITRGEAADTEQPVQQ